MKGISDIIAVLLMLIITIGLAALAYSYISGVFTSRTAVKLSIDADTSSCDKSTFHFVVRNDGSTKSGAVTITVTDPNGNNALSTACKISGGVPAMSTVSQDCLRDTTINQPVGGYKVSLSTGGATVFTTTFYCGVATK